MREERTGSIWKEGTEEGNREMGREGGKRERESAKGQKEEERGKRSQGEYEAVLGRDGPYMMEKREGGEDKKE